jgi:membrane protein
VNALLWTSEPRHGIWRSRFHGFVDVLRDAIGNFMRNGDTNQAAAIALYAFLSIIPLFVLSVLVAGRFLGSGSHQTELVETLGSLHPGFTDQLMGQLGQIEEKRRMLGWIGIGTLVWLSSLVFGGIETALNISFRSRRQRNYFHSKLLAFSMIPLGWAIAFVNVALTAFAAIFHLSAVLRFIIPGLISVLLVTAIYRLTPTRRLPMKIILTGSLIFSVLMEPVKHIFTWYVANHTRYHEIFGSLETVVILVIWVFYLALIFLFCAEIMSSYERRDLILIERALVGGGHKRNGRLFRKFGRPYPAGSLVFQEGSQGREMYFILAGRIRLERKAGSTLKPLAELGPGNYFGEMAALAESPRTATAYAAEDTELAVIDGDVFRQLLRESDDVALHMLQEFSRRIQHTNAALDEFSQSRVQMLVLIHLLRFWPKDSTLEHLALAAGVDIELLPAILARLEAQEILQRDGGSLFSFNRDRAWTALNEFSGGHPELSFEPSTPRGAR